MEWSKIINPYISTLSAVPINDGVIQRVNSLLDVTSLNDSDTESSIAFLLEKIHTSFGPVAGVCVAPQFVRLVAAEFAAHQNIKAITVANFPTGDESLEKVLIEIGIALENGAQEIDIVFPYRRYLAGDKTFAQTFVTACKAACGNNTLKIILETGAIADLGIIADAAKETLMAGADFIKTSTGKHATGATPEAAAVILLTIKELQPQLNRPMGLKVAGGLKTLEKAAQFIELADKIMGKKWTTPETFRIGSSVLIDVIQSATV